MVLMVPYRDWLYENLDVSGGIDWQRIVSGNGVIQLAVYISRNQAKNPTSCKYKQPANGNYQAYSMLMVAGH